MNKEDIVYYIRDVMLQNPYSNADLVYKCSNIALKDEDMYELFNLWMKSNNSYFRTRIEDLMLEFVVDEYDC